MTHPTYRIVYTALSQITGSMNLAALSSATGLTPYSVAQLCAGLSSLGCIHRGGGDKSRRTYRAVREPTNAELDRLMRISASPLVNGHTKPQRATLQTLEEIQALRAAREETARHDKANALYDRYASQIRFDRSRGQSLKTLRNRYGESAVNYVLGNVTPFGDLG